MSSIGFPVSTVKMSSNDSFTGRDDGLNDVHDFLSNTDSNLSLSDDQSKSQRPAIKTGPACCVLNGIGGIGKTQIALEYIHRYRTEYDAIFWVEAQYDWTLTSTYAQISNELALLDPKTLDKDCDNQDLKQQNLAIDRVRDWLQSTGERLNPFLISSH